MNFLHKIKNGDYWYDLKWGVKNLIKWFPIVWRDRDWDHYFIFQILKFKLEQVEKQQREYGHHLNNLQTAKHIKICVNLLDRLIKDNYHENTFYFYHKKWGKPRFNWTDCEDREGYSKLDITHPNVKNEKDEELEKKEYRILSKHMVYMQNQDLEYLFNKMKRHILGWWD